MLRKIAMVITLVGTTLGLAVAPAAASPSPAVVADGEVGAMRSIVCYRTFVPPVGISPMTCDGRTAGVESGLVGGITGLSITTDDAYDNEFCGRAYFSVTGWTARQCSVNHLALMFGQFADTGNHLQALEVDFNRNVCVQPHLRSGWSGAHCGHPVTVGSPGGTDFTAIRMAF